MENEEVMKAVNHYLEMTSELQWDGAPKLNKKSRLWAVVFAEVRKTLVYHRGNRMRTAKDLGVSIRTLRNWIALMRVNNV